MQPESQNHRPPEATYPRVYTIEKQPFPWVVFISTGIAMLITGFAGGTWYGKHLASTTPSPKSGQPSANSNGGSTQQDTTGRMNRMGAFGTVTSVSSSSITITEQRDSTTKTYKITSSTTVKNGTSTGSLSDITKGSTVMVSTSSSDSSTAETITVNPTMPSMNGQSGIGEPPSGYGTSN